MKASMSSPNFQSPGRKRREERQARKILSSFSPVLRHLGFRRQVEAYILVVLVKNQFLMRVEDTHRIRENSRKRRKKKPIWRWEHQVILSGRWKPGVLDCRGSSAYLLCMFLWFAESHGSARNVKPFLHRGDAASWTWETNTCTNGDALTTTGSSDDEELGKSFYPNQSNRSLSNGSILLPCSLCFHNISKGIYT